MPQDEGETPAVEDPRSPEEVARAAQAILDRAAALVEAGKLEKARVEYGHALLLLVGQSERAQDGEWKARLDRLFLLSCLGSVRLARLRGVLLTTEEEEESDLGIQYNPQVERWLIYYMRNGRQAMQKALIRAGAYTEMIDRVLAEKQLPKDLKYLPIIESEFYLYARSHASAVGMWQFIPGTGRRYGLKIDSWVDERLDPQKGTRAAADYLADLHGMFGDWSLALAGYNCGEGRVASAIKSAGTKDFWGLTLPLETTDYVPKFFAAMMIGKQPELYGFFVEPNPAIQVAQVRLEGVAGLRRLAELSGMDYDELKRYNPELLGSYTPPKEPEYMLNLPANRLESFQQTLKEYPPEDLYLRPAEIRKLIAPKVRGRTLRYKVKKGDSLWNIARRYKTTVRCLKRLNRKIHRNMIRPGQKIRVQRGCKK